MPVAPLMRRSLGDNHSLAQQWTLEVFPALFTWFLWTNRGFPSQQPVTGGQGGFCFINSDDSSGIPGKSVSPESLTKQPPPETQSYSNNTQCLQPSALEEEALLLLPGNRGTEIQHFSSLRKYCRWMFAVKCHHGRAHNNAN